MDNWDDKARKDITMMPVPEQGMNIDPQILIRTQSLFISDARVKEVQMEAAIQMLLMEKQQLTARVEELEATQSDEVADDAADS